MGDEKGNIYFTFYISLLPFKTCFYHTHISPFLKLESFLVNIKDTVQAEILPRDIRIFPFFICSS